MREEEEEVSEAKGQQSPGLPGPRHTLILGSPSSWLYMLCEGNTGHQPLTAKEFLPRFTLGCFAEVNVTPSTLQRPGCM